MATLLTALSLLGSRSCCSIYQATMLIALSPLPLNLLSIFRGCFQHQVAGRGTTGSRHALPAKDLYDEDEEVSFEDISAAPLHYTLEAAVR